MVRSESIRILLAFVVAFWSPAWCCCRIVQSQHCSPQSAEHAVEAAQHDGDDNAQSTGLQGCELNGPCDEGCGCQSHDVRATLVSAEAVPLADLVHSPGVLISGVLTGLIDFDQIGFEHRIRRDDPAAAGMVRAQSLFARHCLLLV